MSRFNKIVGLLILAGCSQSPASKDATPLRDAAHDLTYHDRTTPEAKIDAPVVPDVSPGCPVCGNGIVECGELCDNNGVEERCDYGTANCRVCGMDCRYTIGFGSVCGDSTVDVSFGEQCDDGGQTRTCPHRCQLSDCAGIQDLSGYQNDYDCDGVPDETDNCVTVSNADQLDSNDDKVGDSCEFLSSFERCLAECTAKLELQPPPDASPQPSDGGGCGCGCGGSVLINNCYNSCGGGGGYQYADDYDSDGWEDDFDNCPFVPNVDQADGDGDGVGDACDPVDCTPELLKQCQ